METIDSHEFEERQSVQMRLIQASGDTTTQWITENGERFSKLWDDGIRNIFELKNLLKPRKETLRENLAKGMGITVQKWNTRFPEFDSMYENGDFGTTKEQEQIGIYILYNKTRVNHITRK